MHISGQDFLAANKNYEVTLFHDKEGKPFIGLIRNHPDGQTVSLIHRGTPEEINSLFDPLNIISKQLLALKNTLDEAQFELENAQSHQSCTNEEALQRFHDAIKVPVQDTTQGLLMLISDIQAMPQYSRDITPLTEDVPF